MKFRLKVPDISFLTSNKKAVSKSVKNLSTKELINQMKTELIAEQIKTTGNFSKYIESQTFGIPQTGLNPSPAIAGVAMAVFVFLVVITIYYGQVQTSLNLSIFSGTSGVLLNLMPLVLVCAAMVGIIVTAIKLSG